MSVAEVIDRALADYAAWGPTPAWPSAGGWVAAMLMLETFDLLAASAAPSEPGGES